MKLRRFTPLLAIAAAVSLLAGCGEETKDASDVQTIRVAAVTAPMTDVVKAAGEAVADDYKIELVEVGDYVILNKMLKDGDIEANFGTHKPFMEDFNAKNDASLVNIQPVYNFVIAFYSKNYDSIEQLPDGAKVAIPDDASNLARALKLLASEGLITLDPAVDPYQATLENITENPKDLQFQLLAISQLNTAYEEADLLFQWPSHIVHLGLNPADDGLITELDDHFALNVVVREGTDEETVKALQDAFSSDEVRKLIEENPSIEVAF